MKVLVTGASGKLGPYLIDNLVNQAMEVYGWYHATQPSLSACTMESTDLSVESNIKYALRQLQPDLIIHSAAISTVGESYQNPDLAMKVNGEAPGWITRWAKNANPRCRVIHLSTDQVFDGDHAPYDEESHPSPLNVYGKSKAQGEKTAHREGVDCLLRLPLMFGRCHVNRPNFFQQQHRSILAHEPLKLFEDEWRTPLSLRHAARLICDIATTELHGLYHLAGQTRVSRYEFGCLLAKALGQTPENIQPCSRDTITFPEPRGRDLSLNTRKLAKACPAIETIDLHESILAETQA